MSVVPTSYNVYFYETCPVAWTLCDSDDTSAQMIPPGDDELKIRFMFYDEASHTFTMDKYAYAVEYWMIPLFPTKAITVRPYEFYNHDATSIIQSPSGRMMVDFINTHFSPKDEEIVPQTVNRIIDVVQNSNKSEAKGFVDVQLRTTIEISHSIDNEADKASMHGYFEATRKAACAICLDDFEIGSDSGARLPCLHGFHGPCIYKWLLINPKCPVCCHPIEVPEIAPWFNAPLQENIWDLHTSI